VSARGSSYRNVVALIAFTALFPICLFASGAWVYGTPSTSYISPIEWMRDYGGEDHLVGTAITECGDNEFLIAGYTPSDYIHYYQHMYFAMRIDALGQVLWEREYLTESYGDIVDLRSIVKSGDNFLLVGTRDSSPEDSQVWVVCINANGAPLWNHTYGGPENEYAREAISCADNGTLVVGLRNYWMSSNRTDTDLWAIRIDGSGTAIWNTTYTGLGDDEGTGAVACYDEGFLLVGSTELVPGEWPSRSAIFLRLNANGTIQWTRTHTGLTPELGSCVVRSHEGGYLLATTTDDAILALWLDDEGDLVRSQSYPAGPPYVAPEIIACGNGYLIAREMVSGALSQMRATRIDSNGVVLWEWSYRIVPAWSSSFQCSALAFSGAGVVLVGPRSEGTLVVRLPDPPTPTGALAYLVLVAYLGISVLLFLVSWVLRKPSQRGPMRRLPARITDSQDKALAGNLLVYLFLAFLALILLVYGPISPIYGVNRQGFFSLLWSYGSEYDLLVSELRFLLVTPLGFANILVGGLAFAALQGAATIHDLRVATSLHRVTRWGSVALLGVVVATALFVLGHLLIFRGMILLMVFLPFLLGMVLVGLFPTYIAYYLGGRRRRSSSANV
jgi:hypothetical protein